MMLVFIKILMNERERERASYLLLKFSSEHSNLLSALVGNLHREDLSN